MKDLLLRVIFVLPDRLVVFEKPDSRSPVFVGARGFGELQGVVVVAKEGAPFISLRSDVYNLSGVRLDIGHYYLVNELFGFNKLVQGAGYPLVIDDADLREEVERVRDSVMKSRAKKPRKPPDRGGNFGSLPAKPSHDYPTGTRTRRQK